MDFCDNLTTYLFDEQALCIFSFYLKANFKMVGIYY